MKKVAVRKKIAKKIVPPNYKNPPLIEVAVSIQFKDVNGFKAAYIGDLWNAFGRKAFPHTEDHPIIHTADGSSIFQSDPYKEMPRTWFLNEEKTELIQFQRNRLVFNWRKTDDNPDASYKRYEYISQKFMSYLQILEKFVKDYLKEPLVYTGMELTYINNIPIASFGGIEKIGDCLKDIAWVMGKEYLPNPAKYKGAWNFELPDINGGMTANVQSLQQVDGTPVLRLDLVAKGLYTSPFDKGNNNMLKWYDKAHEYIVHGFEDLTTQKMQKIWKKL